MAKKGTIGPSLTESNGRAARGRFGPGNAIAKGNPHAKAVNRFRSILLGSVSDNDLKTVVNQLVEKAKAGEPWAVRELFDRLIGKPVAPLDIDLTGGEAQSVVDFALSVRRARGLATGGDDAQDG